jgi:hypothetical protein
VIPQAKDGRNGIRIWEPCDDPNGDGCSIFEDPETLHMAETRWYATSLRIFDGSAVGLLRRTSPFPLRNLPRLDDYRWRSPSDTILQQ